MNPPINRVLGVLLCVIFSLSHTAWSADLPKSSPEKQGVSSKRLERLNELSQQYVDEGRVAGIVNLVMRNGKVIHYQATGARGVNDSGPVKRDDLFRIYSMTKPITAVAAMQLYERGKFQLSDPVSKFVPELADLQVLNAKGNLEPESRQMTCLLYTSPSPRDS